jgi:hypothetical protein
MSQALSESGYTCTPFVMTPSLGYQTMLRAAEVAATP